MQTLLELIKDWARDALIAVPLLAALGLLAWAGLLDPATDLAIALYRDHLWATLAGALALLAPVALWHQRRLRRRLAAREAEVLERLSTEERAALERVVCGDPS